MKRLIMTGGGDQIGTARTGGRDVGHFRKLYLAVLIAAGCFAFPAAASDVAELDCPLARVDRADRATLAAAIAQSSFNEDESSGILHRALRACLPRFEWTQAEYADAYVFVRAALTAAHFRERLAGRGLDLGWLEREVVGDRAFVAAAVEMRPDPPELHALFDRLEPQLRPWADRHSGEPMLTGALGGFIAMTAMAEGARIRFLRH